MVEEKPHISQDKSSSITEAFVKYESFLKRFLSRFLPRTQDIEDVLQDAYLKAYSAEKDREIRSPKAFLFRVARNEALKELAKKSRRIMECIEDSVASEVIYDDVLVEDLVMARQKLGMFCQSALEMTPRCRRVFLMAKVYGYSYKEISSQLDISVSAIEKHVARGLEICNDYMMRMEQAATSTATNTAPNEYKNMETEQQESDVVRPFSQKVQGNSRT